MQPDATAGNTDVKKHPDFWHLSLASAKLFPCKWPCVPLQIKERAEKKGPRGMSSTQPGGGSCPCSWGVLSNPTRVQGFLVLYSFWFNF